MDNNYKKDENQISQIKSTAEQKLSSKVRDIAKTLREEGNGFIESDVTGSYTGLTNEGGVPVQDADDL